MPPVVRRFLAIAASATLITGAAATVGADSAFAALPAPSPAAIANTATAQHVSVTATGLHLSPALTIAGPGGVSFKATGVQSSGSTITGTFDLDPSGLPAPTGAYTLTLTCLLTCSNLQTTITVTGNNPAPTSVTPSSFTTDQSASAVTIAGTNFASGDAVSFRNATSHATDPGVVFTPNFATSTATALHGTLTTHGAVVGTDDVVVTATNGGSGVCSSCASIVPAPVVTISSLSAPAVGRGAHNLPETILGSGFEAGAHVVIESTLGGAASTDVTVSGVTVGSSGQITASISATPTATTGSRFLVVTNPDGSNGHTTFTVDPAPVITKVTAASRGQNSVGGTAMIQGSGFLTGAVVSAGTGISLDSTTGSLTVPNSGQINITGIDVAATATTGQRPVTVTNPDGGTTTSSAASVPSGNQWFFTVVPAPVLTSFTPSTAALGTANLPFDIAGTYTTGQTAAAVKVTSPTDAAVTFTVTAITTTHITGTFTVPVGAHSGLHDVRVVDAFGGTATCTGCLTVAAGISAVSPASLHNTAGSQSLQVTGNNLTTGHHYTLSMTRATAASGQGTVTADGTATGNVWSGTVNINDDAPGAYNLTLTDATTAASVGSCSACFTILPQGTATVSAVSPTQVPAGATTTVVVSGQNLFRGATVSFPAGSGLTAGATTVNSDTTGAVLSVKVPVTVASTAVTGSKVNLTLTNAPASSTADPTQTSTLVNALTVGGLAVKATHHAGIVVHRSKAHLTYGHHLTLTGTLSDTTAGTRLGGVRILLGYRSDAGTLHTLTTRTTHSNGSFSYTFIPKVNGVYYASYAGRRATSTAFGYTIATDTTARSTVKATISIHGRRSGKHGVIVTGTVRPHEAGQTVVLYRIQHGKRSRVATARVTGASHYRFSFKKVAHGHYHLEAGIGASPGHLGATSRRITVVR